MRRMKRDKRKKILLKLIDHLLFLENLRNLLALRLKISLQLKLKSLIFRISRYKVKIKINSRSKMIEKKLNKQVSSPQSMLNKISEIKFNSHHLLYHK